MVTLALIQGVVNTFVMFAARVVGGFVDRAVFRSDDNRGPGIGYFVSVIVLEIVFGILASTIVMWFSRQREFRADAGGARLAGRESMIGALQRLAAARASRCPARCKRSASRAAGSPVEAHVPQPPAARERITRCGAAEQGRSREDDPVEAFSDAVIGIASPSGGWR